MKCRVDVGKAVRREIRRERRRVEGISQEEMERGGCKGKKEVRQEKVELIEKNRRSKGKEEAQKEMIR